MQLTRKPYRCSTLFAAIAVALLFSFSARADLIEMQNGDRYNGKVLSLTNDVMVLQSEVLGTIAFPRSKVAKISLGSVTNLPTASHDTPAASTRPAAANPAANTLAALRQSGSSASEAEKVKQQFLADADPAAKAKFDAMLGDLMSGKMTIADLRVQAKSAADQLRALKKELGPESDASLDGYLSILESFLKEVPANETLPTKTIPSAKRNPLAEKDE